MASPAFQRLVSTPFSGRIYFQCLQRRNTLGSLRGLTLQTTSSGTSAQDKYAEKLKMKAKETGFSVNELLEKADSLKQEARRRDVEELKQEAERGKAQGGVLQEIKKRNQSHGGALSEDAATKYPTGASPRKDAPPYKELSSILNLQKLVSTPHNAEQISALWTAYHASRSGGTGRGFVCASIPLELYHKMAENGKSYSSFVVPVPRMQPKADAVDSEATEEDTAHEFYYLQWDFHPSPPIPSSSDDPFVKPSHKTPDGKSNPLTTTVLFAPLQEYKLRQAFATPYLVLTMYTDLAATHGLVLLRGEITPSSGAQGVGYMMTQEDAQLLTMALQRFYLWSQKDGERQGDEDESALLRTFHEKPEDFRWQDLLRFSSLTA